MAPGTLAPEQRLQKLLSSAGYCGGEAPRTPWDESPSEAILAKPVEVEAVETSHGRCKSSPGRQPRQFSARPPRPENGRKGLASVATEAEAPSLPPVYLGCEESVTEVMSGLGLGSEGESSDDDLPEAPLEGRTQELLAKLSQEEELPAVGIVGQEPPESDSEEDMPKAPMEGQSQEMEDANLEVSITGGLMSSSSSSLGSLTKTLGTTMPTAPEESEAADASDAQPEVNEIDDSPKNPVLRSCSSSSCASSGPPEAPAEDPPELVETPATKQIVAELAPAAPEAPEKARRSASGSDTKVVPPAINAGKQQGGVAGVVPARPPRATAPALEVVGHSRLSARTVPNKTRKSTGSARPAKPTEPPRTRKECSCSFCPSCRRRTEEENMRQAIQRSLQTFASDDLETPPAPASAARPTEGFRPGRAPPAPPREPPGRPATTQSSSLPRARSSPAVNRNRPKALSRGQSIERLRQHTRASIARVSSAGWRAKRNEHP